MNLAQQTAVLERTPGVLHALLSGHEEDLLRADYGPQTFSPFDVLGHLIHCERVDWIARARIILEHGTGRTFDPVDHRAAGDAAAERTVGQRLGAFALLRTQSLETLGAMEIDASKLALRGVHPAFGEVTFAQLIAAWATHDLHHIAQICKALAYQNREAVGPWREYIGIIPRGSA